MKFCPPSTERGVTFVDVLMATAIIAVMCLGLVGSLTYGFFVMQMARENQRATQIMLEKVETIRLYRWDQVVYSNGFVPPTFTEVYDPQAPTNQQGVIYFGAVEIGNFTNNGVSYATNRRQVTVSLNWRTRGIPRARSLVTYIAQDGIQNYVY